MKKVLFIDRDGTLVIEPPLDYQLDSLEKLEFYPGVFRWLSAIAAQLDFHLVMVSNQDGLGTSSFPEKTFWPAHNKIIQSFKNEGVEFSEVLIDRSFPEENSPNRKPGIGLLSPYVYGNFDLANSYVIGDRQSDIELAKNLGAQGIFPSKDTCVDAVLSTESWAEIYRYLKAIPRKALVQRTTKETDIKISLNLDGNGQSKMNTGIGFFDHMLEQIAKHGNLDLEIDAQGDLDIDSHHTIEDVAITLGQAFTQSLGNKIAIERYGFLLPMDDCLAQVAIDFGGRPWLEWEADFRREKLGEMPTEMFMHFFKSFSDLAKCNLHIKATGNNEHHKIEAIFKAFGKALKMAVKKTNNYSIPSTKGVV